MHYLLLIVQIKQPLCDSLHYRQSFAHIKRANVVVESAIIAKLRDYDEVSLLLEVEELAGPQDVGMLH
jgi:hypothetical protein